MTREEGDDALFLEMAQLLFDIFYDEECVSEDTFFQWRNNLDQSEIEGKTDRFRFVWYGDII